MADLVVETILEIDRPIDDVFAFLADTRSFKAVDPALVEYEPAARRALRRRHAS